MIILVHLIIPIAFLLIISPSRLNLKTQTTQSNYKFHQHFFYGKRSVIIANTFLFFVSFSMFLYYNFLRFIFHFLFHIFFFYNFHHNQKLHTHNKSPTNIAFIQHMGTTNIIRQIV